MTPKEKAIQLIDKFKIGDVVTEKLQIVNINIYSKLFALRAVDEIINNIVDDDKQVLNYWAEVKQEIKNL